MSKTRVILSFLCLMLLAPMSPGAAAQETGEEEIEIYIPFIGNETFPDPYFSNSYYIQDLAREAMTNLGCTLGQRVEGELAALSILHFGQPALEAAQDENGNGTDTYGVFNFGLEGEGTSNKFFDTDVVRNATVSFSQGYRICAQSSDGEIPILILVIGVNNFGAQVTSEHGTAWGEMVSQINDDLANTVARDKVFVSGGVDAELAFNSAEATKNWVNGYHESAGILYNFGAAEGCPTDLAPDLACGTALYTDWTRLDIIEISSGRLGSRAVPQVYNAFNAQQWALLMEGNERSLRGSLTSERACEQRPGTDCDAITNWPSLGWNLLSVRIGVSLEYATDIEWQIE